VLLVSGDFIRLVVIAFLIYRQSFGQTRAFQGETTGLTEG
jgi:hypothetical protein